MNQGSHARVASLVCLSLTLAGCSALRQGAFLDATSAKVEPEPGHTVEGGKGCGSSVPGFPCAPPSASVLRVRLLGTGPRTHHQMERFGYDVSVTNISQQVVAFPWSPLPINRRDRPSAGYRHALFEFIVKKDGFEEAVVDMFVLYGAPTVVGSLKDIRPDETVVVRLPGILSGSGYEDARNPVLYPDGSCG